MRKTGIVALLATAGDAPKGHPTPSLVKPGGCGIIVQNITVVDPSKQ
jgi:hypothetical protein